MVVKGAARAVPAGRRGCMEAYAGKAAMEAKARRKHENGRETNCWSRSPRSTGATG